MHRNVLTQLSAVTKARLPEQPDVRGWRRARAATSARRQSLAGQSIHRV